MFAWIGSDDHHYRFAVESSRRQVRLPMRLQSPALVSVPPVLRLSVALSGAALEVRPAAGGGGFEVALIVPDLPESAGEEEHAFVITSDSAGVPPCEVLLRRSACRITEALIQRGPCAVPLRPQTRAALLWYGWGRYSELVGLRRFTSGYSGSDVLVFRPKLRPPPLDDPLRVGAEPLDVISQAWGSPLLVKTGELAAVRDEWERFRLFLSDRLHPFMTRLEAFLLIQSVDDPGEMPLQATLIGSFLGGDLLQAEPFEAVLRGPSGLEVVDRALDRVFTMAAAWYSGTAQARLGNWWKMSRPAGPPAKPGGLCLFGRFDLAKKEDRARLTEGLMWDVDFVREAHLRDHLLGTDGSGLLYRLMELPVRYSLVHGDLHTRNILVDAHHVALLDFGGTGIAPTLFDFARLEVFVRMWCLEIAPSARDIEEYTAGIETLLLDHFTGTEGSLEPVCRMAAPLGIAPDHLLKIAGCIASIRRHALPYCLGTPDRRDYLAVLYLTVFHALRFAGRPSEPVETFRWLMALFWVLEDALSRIVGMEPFARDTLPVKPEWLLDTEWLAAEAAPQRVLYWLARPDGQRALAPLAATRGVLQGPAHHLDVFDHTLLTLAYLEEILTEPVEALLDPRALDLRVHESLRQQGIAFPRGTDPARRPTVPVAEGARLHFEAIAPALAATLTPEARLALKWVALFHDVGKPATRVMVRDPRSAGHKTQFLGHELYGLQLVAGHLRGLFPDPEQYALVEYLYRNHPLHARLLERYQDERRREKLHQCLDTGMLPARERSRLRALFEAEQGAAAPAFPLLLLHGLADRLATRGPAMKVPVALVAEIDIALLTLYFLQRTPGTA